MRKTSYPEQVMLDTIRRAGSDEGLIVEEGHRLGLFEFDAFLPDYNIAIEYDAKYSHDNTISEIRDSEKNQAAALNGIRVIRVRSLACPVLDPFDGVEVIDMGTEGYWEWNKVFPKLLNKLRDMGVPVKDVKVDSRGDELRIRAGYMKPVKNNIAITHPSVAAEWDRVKNFGLSPQCVSRGSHLRAWWKCSYCGKSWHAMVTDRCGQRHSGCPCCNHSSIIRSMKKKAVMQAKAASVSC